MLKFDIPRDAKRRTHPLMPREVAALLEADAKHIRPLLRFLVCTGASWHYAIHRDLLLLKTMVERYDYIMKVRT